MAGLPSRLKLFSFGKTRSKKPAEIDLQQQPASELPCSSIHRRIQAFLQNSAKPKKRRPASSRRHGNRDSGQKALPSQEPKANISCSVCGRSSLASRPIRKLSFHELQAATQHFARDCFIGKEDSEFLYRGRISPDEHVFVKTISRDDDFWRQIEILIFVRHPNIVSLRGFCMEDGFHMLVYEHVCNGSLQWHLSRKNQNKLDWKARYRIAIDVAKCLLYLHEGCNNGFTIHNDIRPQNIYLTHDFAAKVSGFASAEWRQDDNMMIAESKMACKPGYAAPENVHNLHTSKKTDIYAFGVVLLQLISGRDIAFSESSAIVDWAQPLLATRSSVMEQLLEPCLKPDFDVAQLDCMIKAAAVCIKEDPHKRRNMKHILSILMDKD